MNPSAQTNDLSQAEIGLLAHARTPAALIRLALADLQLCEEDNAYQVDMTVWHSYEEDGGYCLVCLAGSVMAKTLNYHPTRVVVDNVDGELTDNARSTVQFPSRIRLLYCALDALARGRVSQFLTLLFPITGNEALLVKRRWETPFVEHCEDARGFRLFLDKLATEMDELWPKGVPE